MSVAQAIATHERLVVVLSGAGTSGRIATACARAFNAVAASRNRQPCFRYLMAGGDAALLRPMENVEDRVDVAVSDLESCISSYDHVIYVGVFMWLRRV